MQCESSSSCSRFVLLLAWISLLIQFLLLAMMNSSDHYSKQILAKLISTWRWLFSLLFSFFNVCYVSWIIGWQSELFNWPAQFVQAKKKEICMEITDARCCIFRFLSLNLCIIKINTSITRVIWFLWQKNNHVSRKSCYSFKSFIQKFLYYD